jgi:hypothetical protein
VEVANGHPQHPRRLHLRDLIVFKRSAVGPGWTDLIVGRHAFGVVSRDRSLARTGADLDLAGRKCEGGVRHSFPLGVAGLYNPINRSATAHACFNL